MTRMENSIRQMQVSVRVDGKYHSRPVRVCVCVCVNTCASGCVKTTGGNLLVLHSKGEHSEEPPWRRSGQGYGRADLHHAIH